MQYLLNIIEINKIEKLDFRDQPVLEEENCTLWDIFNTLLQIDNLFGERRTLYKIKIEINIPLIRNIGNILKNSGRRFILFDLVHDIPNLLEDKLPLITALMIPSIRKFTMLASGLTLSINIISDFKELYKGLLDN